MLRLFLAGLLSLLVFGCQSRTQSKDATAATYTRVISLAPSITETIFLIGKGNVVKGVSDFCTWPKEVKNIQHLGGYLDPNFEVMLSLKPDLVFILKEQSKVADFCKSQNIKCVLIDDHNLSAVVASIDTIAQYLGATPKGDSLTKNMREKLSADTASPKPSIMITIGRDGAGTGKVSSCWVAAQGTFYGELITLAGAKNIMSDTSANYPTISAEAIMRLKPDIIIDVMPSMEQYRSQAQKLKKDWQIFTTVPAIQDSQVFSVSADYATIPSPRIMMLLSDVRRIVGEWRLKKMKPKNIDR